MDEKTIANTQTIRNKTAEDCAILAMRIEHENPKHLGPRLIARQTNKIVSLACKCGILTDELVAWVEADVEYILSRPHSAVGRIRLRNTLGAIFSHCRYPQLS